MFANLSEGTPWAEFATLANDDPCPCDACGRVYKARCLRGAACEQFEKWIEDGKTNIMRRVPSTGVYNRIFKATAARV